MLVRITITAIQGQRCGLESVDWIALALAKETAPLIWRER